MNKVKYGLKNVYYSVITEGTGGALTYATPVAWPGAVNLSMSASGDSSTFRADNSDYWVSAANNGYEGTLETALIPDSFRTDVLGEVEDQTTGYVRELNDANPKEFALLFQFEGDEKATRHLFYRCSATRPDVTGQTTENPITPQTETINIRALARISDGYVKARCEEGSAGYASFFEAVA